MMKLTKSYLASKGWVERAGIMVFFSNPRLGWKPDGTMIVGYHELKHKIKTIEELEAIWQQVG